jgi:hypothetical protein
MTKNNKVKKGGIVRVIIEVWGENKLPIYRKFYTGSIIEVVVCRKSCSYVRISGLDKLIPVDGVIPSLD